MTTVETIQSVDVVLAGATMHTLWLAAMLGMSGTWIDVLNRPHTRSGVEEPTL